MSTVDLVKRRDSGCTGQPPAPAPTNHKELSSPRYSGGSTGKKFSCNAGHAGDTGSIPRSERSSGVGDGNLLQDSCLENLMGRGASRATVHEVAESDTTEGTEHAHRYPKY